MGQLVFQATLGGQVNLVGPNTASTFNLSVPAVTATLATTDANTFTGAQTFSAGTANGVAYLNGSKVLTTGSALTFDGANLGVGRSPVSGYKAAIDGDIWQGNTAGTVIGTIINNGGWYEIAGSVNVNGLQFAHATWQRWMLSGSEQMRLTSTGLGIGTSSPAAKLESVQGTSGAGGWYMAGQFSSATATMVRLASTTANKYASIGNDSDGGFHLFVNGSSGAVGTEAAILNASGNLGLGVTPSAGWFSPQYRAIQFPNGWTSLASDSGNGTVLLGSNFYADGNTTYKYINSNYATLYQQNLPSGQHRWYVAPSGTAGNPISFTQAMTLDASGNLGVGITSPTAKTHIVQAVSGTSLKWSDNTYDTGFLDIINQGARISANNNLVFNTNGADRARIDSSGNLLVGTTATINAAKAVVAFSSSNNGLYVQDSTGVSAAQFMRFDSTSNTCGSITRVGTTSAVTYNATSDYRLKTVIGPVADAGQRIDALEPIEYTWKEDGTQTRGFLAHKFQEIYAHSVSGTKDAVDAQGNPVYQSMQAGTSEVIADLVAEIQSLRKRLAAAGI